MNLPRFENPHLIPRTTVPATRAELYPSYDAEPDSTNEDEVDDNGNDDDREILEQLNKLVRKRVRYEVTRQGSPDTSVKRRRLDDEHDGGDAEEEGEEEAEEERLVLFRLVSSVKEPRLLSLLPAPSPPTLTRPPESEDNEMQATIRQERAVVAAVDGEAILGGADISPHKAAPVPTIHMKLRGNLPNPPDLLVVETTQKPRRTRPPVSTATPLSYPYTNEAALPSEVAPYKTKCIVVPVIEPNFDSTAPAQRRSRHRRKWQIDAQAPKSRPPPQFWRPSPGMTGKCRGYAYGYPGSFLAAAEARGYVNETNALKYKHDTMKKGRYAE